MKVETEEGWEVHHLHALHFYRHAQQYYWNGLYMQGYRRQTEAQRRSAISSREVAERHNNAAEITMRYLATVLGEAVNHHQYNGPNGTWSK